MTEPITTAASAGAERMARNTQRAGTYRDFSRGFLYPEAEELRAQHRRIFGHALSPDCPPYETQYGPGHVFQQTQTMADIAGFYRAFGVAPSDSKPERVDHLCMELEFMAYLAVKEALAAEAGRGEEAEICRDAQKKFLEDHLGRWADAFARAIERKESGHYAELSRALARFVAQECRDMGAAPKKVESAAAGKEAAARGESGLPEAFDACFSCGADDSGPGPEGAPRAGHEGKDAGFSGGGRERGS